MESKFQPFDIKNFCRVYFAFIEKDNTKTTLYYDRPQFLPDEVISSEAKVNAVDMQKRFGFVELLSIYIARTSEQVAEYETDM